MKRSGEVAPTVALGPREAANGVLMFGMTSAALMAILQQLIKQQLDASPARGQ